MTDVMPRPRLPHLRHETNRHGNKCWYFRKEDGPRIRMPEPYGSKEFEAAYNAALTGVLVETKTVHSGTVQWLVDRYKESSKFTSLKESTQAVRSRVFKSFCDKSGDKPFAKIERKHIQAAMEAKAKTAPHAANNALIYISQMFDWAVANEKIKINPCDGIKLIKLKSDGFHSWAPEEVDKYREFHPVGTKARLALDILLFCGLRRSDIVRAGRQHVKGGVMSIKTEKTGEWVYLPIFPELQRSIDQTNTGDLAFLTSATGQPFASAQSFGNWFKARCREAGLPENCTAHGLRKAGATIAANDGASAKELMAMFGWTRIEMAELYTKEADKIRLARAASERIANSRPPHLEQSAADNPENEMKSRAKN